MQRLSQCPWHVLSCRIATNFPAAQFSRIAVFKILPHNFRGLLKIFEAHNFRGLPFSKFSSRTIFADCRFQNFRGAQFSRIAVFKIFEAHNFRGLPFSKFSRRTIFADCRFQNFRGAQFSRIAVFKIFEAHNFRGLAFSKISRKQFSRIADSAIAPIRYSKILRSLNFGKKR